MIRLTISYCRLPRSPLAPRAKWTTLEEELSLHIEIIPRLARPQDFEKGSGFYICPIPPEETAEY